LALWLEFGTGLGWYSRPLSRFFIAGLGDEEQAEMQTRRKKRGAVSRFRKWIMSN
jgi:hypothetical protein